MHRWSIATAAATAFVLTTSVACDDEEDRDPEATSRSEPAETADDRSDDDGDQPAAASGEPSGGDPESADAASRLTAADARRYRESLAAGRQAATTDWETAVAHFRRALEVSPTDPVARCELGWALFKTGEPDEAAKHLDAGVGRFEGRGGAIDLDDGQERTWGACLYNRGRVAEALDAPAAAIRFYRESLRHRDNAVVRRRLARWPPIRGRWAPSANCGLR